LNLDHKSSSLPFIFFPLNNLKFKCLIDTGSTKSFINPELAKIHFPNLIQHDPFTIITAHGVSNEKFSVYIPTPKIFKSPKETMKFHLFKFHENFDFLVGLDNLKNIKAKVNLINNTIELPLTTLKINFEDVRKRKDLNSIKRPQLKGNLNNNSIVVTSNSDDLTDIRMDHMNKEEKHEISKLLKNYKDLFHYDENQLTFSNTIKHEINLKNDSPIHTKSYRYPHVHKVEIQNQIQKMLENGIIRPSQSPWSSPIWVVPKKSDASGKKKWRMVVDYRKLNEQTIDDRYPIPNITDILDKLGRSQYFSTIDLASGFHQIEVAPKDIEKTAFSVENGHFEFTRMPFGLKNAPATFQRVMDNVLRGLQHHSCIVYLDDIIIFSTSLQEHVVRLKTILDRLRQYNFKIQLDKCEFLRKEVEYLGHVVTTEGIRPNLDKIKAIIDFPIPKTPKQLKSFLGLLGFYRKFIKNFAKIVKPLTVRLKKDKHIDPKEPEYINCFNLCKTLLTNDPILQYPNFEKPFILTTDASDYAIGAVLSQGPIGSDLPIAYASRTLNEHEINYSTTEKELLAIVWSTQYFRPYLYGRKFRIITDHKPLQWLFSLKEPNSKLVRWRLRLEEYDYEIQYKPGKLNSNADALSRPPNCNVINSSDDDRPPILRYMERFNKQLEQRDPLDTRSIIVEPGDTDEQNLDDTDLQTVHTSRERPICNVPISEDPINFGANQITFKFVQTNPIKTKLIKLFNNTKTRLIVQISKDNYEENIIDLIREYIKPNVIYSCHFSEEELYRIFCSVVREKIKNNIRFKKCAKILIDVDTLDEQHNLIQEYHLGKCNHRGVNETYLKLSKEYYWPNMQLSIQNFIAKCEICRTVKYDRKPIKLKFNITPTPTKPFEIVHVDTLKYECKKFLTIIDAFSKYAQVYLLETSQGQEIAENLMHYFSHHSVPGLLVMDNGPEFDNGVVRDFLLLHKVDTHFCSPHHPPSNGLIERFHSTFLDHINILNNSPQFSKDSVKSKIHFAIIAYNNSIHSSTGKTPFEILNFDMQMPSNIDLEAKIVNNYIDSHKEKVKEIHKIINENLSKNKTKIINKLNEKRESIPEIPKTVFIKSNFRSKRRNRYKKEEVLEVNPERKTVRPKLRERKRGRQFSKLHIGNIKRPNKIDQPSVAGPSSSS